MQCSHLQMFPLVREVRASGCSLLLWDPFRLRLILMMSMFAVMQNKEIIDNSPQLDWKKKVTKEVKRLFWGETELILFQEGNNKNMGNMGITYKCRHCF